MILVLLWLWCRPAAAAPIQHLSWEPPNAEGIAQKKERKKQRKKETKKQRKKQATKEQIKFKKIRGEELVKNRNK